MLIVTHTHIMHIIKHIDGCQGTNMLNCNTKILGSLQLSPDQFTQSLNEYDPFLKSIRDVVPLDEKNQIDKQ